MVKILITGGCGFIGTNLIDFIMEKTDWHVNVLDDLSVGKLEYLKSLKYYDETRIDFHRGDIRSEEDVKPAIIGCDYAVHLAAQTDVMKSIDDPEKDADINIMGTINVLKMAVDEGIKAVSFSSSAAPLGDQEQPVHEGKVPQPLSPYGASKLSCEGYCSAFAGSYNLSTSALRFSNVYGPNSWHKGSVVAKFIKQILDGDVPVIYGDGKQTRDFIHTEDISNAVYLSLINSSPGFDLYQLGTGEETGVNSLYYKIKDIMEKKVDDIKVPEPAYGEERTGEIYRSYCDVSKAMNELGYEPQVSIDDGLEETVDWFLENY
ncbi:MAG: GDP-mannose 4,6-dehydratase [Thermoplasmata archaeon]